MVTERYRLLEWHAWDDDGKTTEELAARELYDELNCSQENRNLADLLESVWATIAPEAIKSLEDRK